MWNYRRNADSDIQALLRSYIASGDQQLLSRYIRELERTYAAHSFQRGASAFDVDHSIMKQYIWALDEAGMVDDHHEEIFAGIAKGFFVNAWANEIDERGIAPGGDYYYNSPPTPPSAEKFTKEYLTKLTKEVGLSLNGFYMLATRFLHPNYDRNFTPEHFGYLISASAVGSGVGLWEALPAEIAEIPDETYDLLGDDLCDICGSVYALDDNTYVVCDNDACTGGDLNYEGQDDLRATICDDCRFGCEACDVILCAPCGNEHDCDVDEYNPDNGDIATEDDKTWFQYGKLYHKGSVASLWKKLDEDKFWPNVFSISDHGNVFQIIRGEDGNEDEEEEDWECESCGHDEVIIPTFCNFEHCAECFDAVDEEHADCSWDGNEEV